MPSDTVDRPAGHYLDDATYARLVHALLSARDEDALKIALGEIGDTWPLSIAITNLSEGLTRSGDPIGDC
ncbi:hypothetical protein EDC22_102358 [Tepidamorphus gemmatus]|uniref:Uncharacterized protein n=1 Tax=Tepidamorphus gemmatus TaxID=747076 RepID=A0A4V2UZV3_9HYPH|nr:hypothetical protein [Tepidamorphus gemmatus]TCT12673.1 hypothetical protein EDC22_102358 [Tepidamorphus gemmatus]